MTHFANATVINGENRSPITGVKGAYTVDATGCHGWFERSFSPLPGLAQFTLEDGTTYRVKIIAEGNLLDTTGPIYFEDSGLPQK